MSKLKERTELQQKIILDGHQKYIDWWSPIDIAGDSFLAPMALPMFMEYLITKDDKEWFDRWLNKDEFIIPKNGDDREARLYMKKFILKYVKMFSMGWIDLHDKGNQFKKIKTDEDMLKEFIDEVINDSNIYGSGIYDRGVKLLETVNKSRYLR